MTISIDRSIRFIPRHLHAFSENIDPNATDIISKCSTIGMQYVSIESKMLKECGGMFGVMTYYHSSIVCHKKGIPSTNHFFLKEAKFWHLYRRGTDDLIAVPNFRVSVQHFSQFSGHSLITIPDPKDLFVSIVHAALGEYLSD